MTRHPTLPRAGILLVFALACLPLQAQAPYSGQDLRQATSQLDCRQLAAMPNPPMSVEACEAQKAAFAGLGAAMDAPGGERPGDATMGCDGILAELQASHFAGVSAATAAEGAAAGAELQAAMDANRARAAGLAARQGLETAAASTGPNAVQGAVALRHEAEQAALRRSAMADIRPAQARTGLANAASAQELAASLAAHPRVATLLRLAAARNCDLP